jgi:alpha-galactosidase
MNPLQLDWTIAPGQTFFSPEAVAVYSNKGLGQMSRHFHRLYRDHLSKSPWTYRDRPVLINNWEATYFEFDEEKIYKIAEQASEIGCSLVREVSVVSSDHRRCSTTDGSERNTRGTMTMPDSVTGR